MIALSPLLAALRVFFRRVAGAIVLFSLAPAFFGACSGIEVITFDDLPQAPPVPKSPPDRRFSKENVASPGKGLPARSEIVLTTETPAGSERLRYFQEGALVIVTWRRIEDGVETGYRRALPAMRQYTPLLNPPREITEKSVEDNSAARMIIRRQASAAGPWRESGPFPLPEPGEESAAARYARSALESWKNLPPRWGNTTSAHITATWADTRGGVRWENRVSLSLDGNTASFRRLRWGVPDSDSEIPLDDEDPFADPDDETEPLDEVTPVGAGRFWRDFAQAFAMGLGGALPPAGDAPRESALRCAVDGEYELEHFAVEIPLPDGDPLNPPDTLAESVLAFLLKYDKRKR